MGNSFSENVHIYTLRRAGRKFFRRVVRFLACVVAFVTTYALILPAITMEKETFCGYEEHAHQESCYRLQQEYRSLICSSETLQIHVHGDGCYSGETLVCNQADYVVHSHDDSCYLESQLVCTLPERAQHVHGDSCYETYEPIAHEHTERCEEPVRGQLLCTEEEREGHAHDAGCHEPGAELVCTVQEAHQHGDDCYSSESKLACTLSEEAPEGEQEHQHDDSCYIVETKLNCTEPENHLHEESCYQLELTCEIPEDPGHVHEDGCYEWQSQYICGMEAGELVEQEPVLICTEPDAAVHTHNDDCFETVVVEAVPVCGQEHDHTYECYELGCQIPEHTHDLPCYSDATADVESREYWEATMQNVTLTGDWNADVVAIAESQLGYRESERNYAVWEDNTVHGYTRYGQWYGMPYADWCGMFASFCLHYAGVEEMPYHYGVRAWIEQLSAPELALYASAQDYTPIPGDLVFFDWEKDGLSDHVGIVYEVVEATETEPAKLKTIEGNSSNCVQICTYDLQDQRLLGYSMLPEEPTEDPVETPAEDEKSAQPQDSLMDILICGISAHSHGEDCLDEANELLCELQEHSHTIDCISDSSPVGYANSGGGEAATWARFNLRATDEKQYHEDIGPLLFHVVIEDKNGTTVYDSDNPNEGSGEIILGDMYEVLLVFKENTGNQYADGQLTYTLPDYLASTGVSDGVIVDKETGALVARYIVNDTQLIITPEPTKPGEPHFFEAHVDTEIEVLIDAQAVFNPENHDVNVKFNEEFTANLHTRENATLVAEKELVEYDPLTRTAKFTCTSTAHGGRINLRTVADSWWSGSIAVDDYESVKVPRDSVVLTDMNGNDITDQWNVVVDYRSDIWMEPWPGNDIILGHGEYVTLTYEVQFSEDLVQNLNFENTYYTFGYFNDGQQNIPKEDTQQITVPITFTNVVKNGSPAVETIGDETVPVLKWTVTIANQDLEEITITDQLSAGQTFCDHQDVLILAQSPDAGQTQIRVPWADIQTSEGNTKFELKLPEGYTSYELVYYSHYTLQENGPGIQNFENTVTTNITIGGVPTTGTANVGVPAVFPTMDKKITNVNAGDDYMAYSIECHMPKELYGQSSVHLYDSLTSWGGRDGLPLQSLDGLTVTVQPVNGQSYRLQPYNGQESADNTYLLVEGGQEFTMYFNTAVASSGTSVWKCDTDSTLTISYRVPLDTPMLDGWGGNPTEETLLQFLNQTGQKLNNYAKLDYSPGAYIEDTVEFVLPQEEKKPLTKTAKAVEGEDGVYEYSVWFSTGAGQSSIFPLIHPEGITQNDVSNLKLTDIFDSRMEYVEGSLEVSLWSWWNHQELVLTYLPAEDKGPVLEQLPNRSWQMTVHASDLIGQPGHDWMSGQSLMFALKNFYAGYQYEFTYKLRVRDDVKNTTTEGALDLDNTAQVDWVQQTDGPMATNPASCQVVYETGILDKTMKRSADDSNMLSFSIRINENALDLMPESDTFVLHDKMTENLTLIYTSLKIELLDEDGNVILPEKKPEEYGFTFNPDENRMSLILPDSQSILLTYNCKVNGEGGQEMNVGNTVQIEGHEDIHDEINTKFLIRDHTGSVDASSKEFMLQKQDAYNFRTIPGVSFELYGDTERKGNKTITVSGKKLWYYETFTTDENGMVLIKESQLSTGHLYALLEGDPPAGYLPQQEPYLFYMEEPPPGSALDVDVVAEGALVVIKNFPITYTLPKTGAMGSQWFTLCGLMLSLPVTYQFYRKRKKEDANSS